MTRAETQGRGGNGLFNHHQRVTQRHPYFPFPVFLCASAPLREISAAGVRFRNGDEDVATPFENGNGAAMSSSPWESLCTSDEDVATPFRGGAA